MIAKFLPMLFDGRVTAAQLTFTVIATALTGGLGAFFYAGVRRRASVRDSLLAATMAAALCAIPIAIFCAGVVNALIEG